MNKMKMLATASVALLLTQGSAVLAQAAAPVAAAYADQQVAEAMLLTIISEARSGIVNYDRMEPDIVQSVKAGQASVIAQLQSYGEVLSISSRGKPGRGAVRVHKFDVQHANGRSRWRISLGADGRISNLLFQPA
jgi:hypothetical protein